MPFSAAATADLRVQRALMLPALAAVITALIFVIDALTSLHVAIAVLYVAVVLLSANFLSRRGVLLTTLGCIALTVAGFLMSVDAMDQPYALARAGVSLAAIAITGFLTRQNKAVTEHLRERQEALRRSEAFLAGTQRLSRTGSVSVKLPGHHMYWSDESARIYGYDSAIPPSLKLVMERTHPDDASIVGQAVAMAEAGQPTLDLEHRLVMPDGTVKHVRFLAHATQPLSGQREYLGALMDITEAKKNEEKMHRLQSELAHASRVSTLGELAASIAHEVNQPLAAIMTNGQACVRWLNRPEPDLSEARASVERMLAETRRATDVITRIRALAQNRDPQHVVLDVNCLIRESLLLVRREAGNHIVQIHAALSPIVPRVVGDRVQLQQVLINLIINGIHAMDTVFDRPRLVEISSTATPEGAVLIAVRDSGTGISAEHMEKLFSAFFTTKDGGMGMGLSICRSIIDAHNGQLWAENNEQGPGATLQFTLPGAPAQAD
jgi:two-component system sensor kinase FixL